MNRFNPNRSPKKQAIKGFTLIELLVTISIVAIIASSAIPAYSAYTANARETSAIVMIDKISLTLENYFSEFLNYRADLNTLKIPESDGWYTYSIKNDDDYSYGIYAISKPESMVSMSFKLDHLGRQYHRKAADAAWRSGWP